MQGKEDTHRTIGNAFGHPHLIAKEDATFVVDLIARKDRANEGLSMAEALEIIQDVLTKLSLNQVYNCFKRTILPNNKSVLKSTTVVSQRNTAKNLVLQWSRNSFGSYATTESLIEFDS